MNPLIPSTAALAVSAIYCLYQELPGRPSAAAADSRRVAYMLWQAATRQP